MVSFSAFIKATLHHRSRTGLFSKTLVKKKICVAMGFTSETMQEIQSMVMQNIEYVTSRGKALAAVLNFMFDKDGV